MDAIITSPRITDVLLVWIGESLRGEREASKGAILNSLRMPWPGGHLLFEQIGCNLLSLPGQLEDVISKILFKCISASHCTLKK